MKRFGNLFQKIATFENLEKATKKASRSKKSKNIVAKFCLDLESELISLEKDLLENTYRPRPYNQFTIIDPKERIISSSDFRDRVAHHAICNLIEPIFERRLIYNTYACRKRKGTHLAVRRCQTSAKKYKYFLKCDIAKYFDSIDHGALKRLLRKIFKDHKLLSLLDIIIDHQPPETPKGKGVPIGNLTSQHFANIYLGELDHFVKEKLRVKGYHRYMDDFVLFHDSKEFFQDALDQIRAFVGQKLALKLKDKATVLAPVSQGIPYLGFRVFSEVIRLKRQNLVRLRKTVKHRERQFKKGLISEQDLIHSVNSVVEHARHGNVHRLFKKEVDKSLKVI